MDAISDLRLINYKVIKTFFELKNNKTKPLLKININPDFNRTVTKIDEDSFTLQLSVKILDNDKNKSVPFVVEIVIQGDFKVINWESNGIKDFALNNSSAILFPYLRNLLATTTLNGNVPPLNLPIVNVVKLFNDNHNI